MVTFSQRPKKRTELGSVEEVLFSLSTAKVENIPTWSLTDNYTRTRTHTQWLERWSLAGSVFLIYA